MTELDRALEALRQNNAGEDCQSKFYNLFLNTLLFVPTVKQSVEVDQAQPGEEVALPMVVEVDGLNYLMLFDTEQRLLDWADQPDVPFVTVPGHMMAEFSAPDLYWALNVGSESAKQFVPEEIAWIKDVVGRCKAEIVKQAGQNTE